MIKKISKKAAFALGVLIVGGFGGIIADRYLFPYLGSSSFFSRYEFLKKGTENITIINKTEEITIKEETSINKITNQVASSVVNIISYDIATEKEISNKKNDINKTGVKNGTGVIVTSDGMIMTHISAINKEKSSYKVMMYDGSMYEASLVGVDAYSDLAFLKVQTNNLSSGSFGNSDDIKSGEKVIAIANNFNSYANRYAAGLISSFNPTLNLAGSALSSSERLEGIYEPDFDYQDYFVGGPVVDYNGQIIGITGKMVIDGENKFFVIPSNKVRSIINRAIRSELDRSAVLGIYYVPISKTYAVEKKLNVESGALIYSASGQQGLAIINDSPAQRSGLRLGDIIVSADGQKIDLEHTLSDLIYKHVKGDKLELVIIRENEEKQLVVEL
jgi:serine protease Do